MKTYASVVTPMLVRLPDPYVLVPTKAYVNVVTSMLVKLGVPLTIDSLIDCGLLTVQLTAPISLIEASHV